jgi:hypothetical protein
MNKCAQNGSSYPRRDFPPNHGLGVIKEGDLVPELIPQQKMIGNTIEAHVNSQEFSHMNYAVAWALYLGVRFGKGESGAVTKLSASACVFKKNTSGDEKTSQNGGPPWVDTGRIEKYG